LIDIKKYKTIIFDCDGVVLNSNYIKAQCFYDSVINYGEELAKTFKNYHCKVGGVSRIKKFEYFVDNILPRSKKIFLNRKNLINKLVIKYESLLKDKIYNAEVSPHINILKQESKYSNWMMISGADHKELNKILEHKKIKDYFNLGIYGSPSTKKEIIKRELTKQKISYPVLFLGDSKVDYEAAINYKMDFIFLFEWTDLPDWKDFCHLNNISYIKNLTSLINN
jgi:phosphoglycolate phosphatase-like HAD superfamily hydrolase